MTEITSVPNHVLQKRACIAAFMDRQTSIHAAPTHAGSWIEFVELGTDPDEREERILDQVTGLLVQTIRAAQERMPSDLDMTAVLGMAKDEGMGELEPDPAMLAISGTDPDGVDEEAVTMARALTLYKKSCEMGLATGGELAETIETAFAALPAETPYMRDVHETAKRTVLFDLEQAMQPT